MHPDATVKGNFVTEKLTKPIHSMYWLGNETYCMLPMWRKKQDRNVTLNMVLNAWHWITRHWHSLVICKWKTYLQSGGKDLTATLLWCGVTWYVTCWCSHGMRYCCCFAFASVWLWALHSGMVSHNPPPSGVIQVIRVAWPFVQLFGTISKLSLVCPQPLFEVCRQRNNTQVTMLTRWQHCPPLPSPPLTSVLAKHWRRENSHLCYTFPTSAAASKKMWSCPADQCNPAAPQSTCCSLKPVFV